MHQLNGKKILFIAPEFFNYHTEIISELEGSGAKVDFYKEKIRNPFYKVIVNSIPFIKSSIDNIFLNIMQNSIKTNYDYVFLIKGEIVTPTFLNKIRSKNLKAKFILYQWDSVKFNLNFYTIYSIFDKVITFDIIDAKKLNIEYLPLFFTKKYQNIKLNKKKEFDIVFFGTLHGDRLDVIKKIVKECDKYGLVFKYHLYIKKLLLLKKIFTLEIKLKELKYLRTSTVSSETIIQNYSQSTSVLDIQLLNQDGLTMRSIEVLGSGLKLITTNNNITNESIYNKSCVQLIDKNNISLEIDFFKVPCEVNMHEYRLNEWLKKIFEF